MDAIETAERVSASAVRVAAELNLELVHVEVARGSGPGDLIVRVFIDKSEGVTHEDCAKVSFELGTILDVEDFISSAYTLEVSSPGLERGLYKINDYSRFQGKAAKLKTRQPIQGQRNFRGLITGVDDHEVLFNDRTSGQTRIPFDIIVKANLEIDIEEEFRRAREREEAALLSASARN